MDATSQPVQPVFSIPLHKGIDGTTYAPELEFTQKNILCMRETSDDPDLLQYVSWYAPDVAGILLPLTLLLLIVVTRRILRTRREVGRMFCARCNYKITPPLAARKKVGSVAVQPGARCPECGTMLEKRRPRIGRSTAWRLLPWWLVAVPAMLVCLAALALTLEAKGTWARAWPWPGAERFMGAYAMQKRDLRNRRASAQRISQWSIPDGKRIGREWMSEENAFMGGRVSPDGAQFLFFSVPPGTSSWRIESLDLATGERRVPSTPESLKSGKPMAPTISGEIEGFSEDGRRMFVQMVATDNLVRNGTYSSTVHVLSYDLKSLEATEIASFPVPAAPSGFATPQWPDVHTAAMEFGGAVRWATQVRWQAAGVLSDPTIIAGDGAARVSITVPAPTGMKAWYMPRLVDGGQRVEVQFWGKPGASSIVDLATGAITPGTSKGSPASTGVSRNGAYRVHGGPPPTVVEAAAGGTVATLALPAASGTIGVAAVSDDGRFVAAGVWPGVSGGETRVWVWDLGTAAKPDQP
jgi:hypothetical protein